MPTAGGNGSFNKPVVTIWKAAKKLREVLDCGSPLPLFFHGAGDAKRQRAAAVQDAAARCGYAKPFLKLL